MEADTFSEEAGLAAGLLATAGLGEATGALALAALTGEVFTTGFAAAALTGGLDTALTVGLDTGLAAGFAGALTAVLACTAGLAAVLGRGLATALAGFATALADTLAFTVTAFDLGSFPDLAFTWSLLLELAGLLSLLL
ncbi:hypothetical protein [Rhodoferax lacus]|uniref:hypothetical protein n=1 Tax=Rhodoferax lacus TaxID=2184758 RepID=UPI001F467802|nr:hypothetical protein [Rhodoferax lacus]